MTAHPRLLARAIPSAYRPTARHWYQLFQQRLLTFALTWSRRNRLFEGVYYTLFNRDFSRETAAVAAGRVRYLRDRQLDLPTYYLLRRNIHRLEKGLIMRPRRTVFAADYIGPTVDVFCRASAAAANGGENPEIVWASDVLQEYFAVVDKNEPTIAAAHLRFCALGQPASETNQRSSIPYRRNLDAPPPVDFAAFMSLCRRRRSVRWYLDKPVPRALIDQAIEAAAQAPSACNRQPFAFRIFDDPDRLRTIVRIPLGTKGFGDNVPALAVIVGRLRAYPLARDRHAIYVDGALAAMSFMLALETLGLSTCPINWADQEPEEALIRKALGLEDDERVIMLVALGWPDPDGMVAYSAKRPLSQLREYN